MAPGFPLCINGVRIRTSEALYQACRFPHLPDIQRQIIDERSPMTAKMRIKPLKKRSRQDWDSVRVKIMRWCLRVKLAQNWRTFGELLLSTGDLPIVEQSRKDDFWGAKVSKDGSLVGMNVLGRLLMELREILKSGDIEGLKLLEPPPITNFVLYQQPIEAVRAAETSFDLDIGVKKRGIPPMQIKPVQSSLFAQPTRPQVHNSSTDGSPRDGVTIIKGYPEYKDSGQPFLGEIPAHWDLFRNGRLFSQRNETGFGELPILEVSLKTGVRVRDMDNLKRKQVMSDREKYKRAAQGDIAYNMMRMWQGAVGVAPVDGLVSPAYVVVRPFPEVDCRYFSYLFRTTSYMNEVDAYSRGIVKDRNRLYWQDFKRMPSPVPPVEEQRHITRFLDTVGSKAQRFIRNKRRLIELLKEQKQNVINQAVTRGLNPNVKFKPSGVEWIGDIPEHWDARKLKFASKMIVGGATPASGQSELWDGDVVWVTPQDVSKNERLSSSARKLTSAGFASCSTVMVPPGSVVVTSRAPVGNVSFAEVQLCTNQGCKAVVPDERYLLNEYCFVLLKVMQPVFQKAANGTTFFEISTWAFENIKAPLPPTSEQEAILAEIKEATSTIDQAITRAQREIELMREYRIRLISDVVTGQVDVRGIEVPEVAEKELLALEEDTADADDEGDMDETD